MFLTVFTNFCFQFLGQGKPIIGYTVFILHYNVLFDILPFDLHVSVKRHFIIVTFALQTNPKFLFLVTINADNPTPIKINGKFIISFFFWQSNHTFVSFGHIVHNSHNFNFLRLHQQSSLGFSLFLQFNILLFRHVLLVIVTLPINNNMGR